LVSRRCELEPFLGDPEPRLFVEGADRLGSLLSALLSLFAELTVVIVEFKKPMRDDYTSGRDPVQQVRHYVKMLRNEKAIPDIKGRPIRGVNASTAFHCYAVADITQTLEDRIIGRFHHTPDGVGYFGYSADPPAFVEIVPYGKILADSKVRNAVFFKTLGITSEG
jgi:hypothetical protein